MDGGIVKVYPSHLQVGPGAIQLPLGLGGLAVGDGDLLAFVVEAGFGKGGGFDQLFDPPQFLAPELGCRLPCLDGGGVLLHLGLL